MKSSRIISLILSLIMLISLVSCNQVHMHTGHGGNNSSSNSDPSHEQGGEGNVTYVYSVLSKTLHLPTCYHIERMSDEYKFEFKGDISVLLEKGYTICRDCLVPKDETEKEPEEDDENKVAREDATYAINAASKWLHTLDCYHLEVMAEKNLKYTDLTLEELIALDEYRPCAFCLPDEAEEWEKNHPEEE